MKLFVAAAIGLVLAGAAWAQVAYLPQDTNHDGFQTKAELVPWYTSHIKALDVNHDGFISRGEFMVLYEVQLKDGSFAKADANKDGKLSGAEIATMVNIIIASDMAFCDSNKDGKISNAEDDACISGEKNQ